MIVALNARFSRDVLRVGEEGRGLTGRAAEAVAQVADQIGGEVISPLQVGINTGGVAGIDEAEQIRIGRVTGLPPESAADLVLGIDGVADANIYVALISNAY